MSDPDTAVEHFLRRWSRRKHAAATGAPDSPTIETSAPLNEATEDPADQPVFDPKTLPPIDSITAASDIRAFLAPGVPEELSRAALRRAWTTDPAIRDFIGLAENQWDFTRPDSVPGFGSLESTPEISRLVEQLFGDAPKEPSAKIVETSVELPPVTLAAPAEDAATASGEDAAQAHEGLGMRANAPPDSDIAAREDEHELRERLPQRKHGSALPK